MEALNIEILSPDGEIFTGTSSAVTVPGEDGSFQVLKDHSPMISHLGNGLLKIEKESGEQVFNVEGGILEVLENKVIILVERINNN